jgi:acyl-CoA synthetase (AMP-forming)/AMP-acid ligase II
MGAPVHQGLTDELCSSFPNFKALLINYGSTEMFLVSQTTSPGELGKPLQGVECKIFKHTANDYNANNMLGPEEVGEIMTWTPYLMSRYLDKEQNDSYWAPDGFAHTGDLGFYKPDGTLVFQGRLKELIKYQGNHLYPNELEQIIKTHPGVAEVAVFGLPHPEVQELVSALVIVKTPNNAVNDVTEEDIKDMVIKSGVEDYKYIRGGVKFVDHIPKNATGKFLRMLLPEFFKNH